MFNINEYILKASVSFIYFFQISVRDNPEPSNNKTGYLSIAVLKYLVIEYEIAKYLCFKALRRFSLAGWFAD